jgi:hypothetical protein
MTVYFFRLVNESAMNLIRSEKARHAWERAGQKKITEDDQMKADPCRLMTQKELGVAARAALTKLPLKLRLPVSLCCEQGLTNTMIGEILGVSQQTAARRVEFGLSRLRKDLAAAGFAGAAPAVLATALGSLGLPEVPASLSTLSAMGGSGNAVLAGTKTGGLTMTAKMLIGGILLSAGTATGWIFYQNFGGGGQSTSAAVITGEVERTDAERTPQAEAHFIPVMGANPVTGRQEREAVFEFAEKPTVTKQGDKTIITFASKGKCDATVAIVGPDGKIVRHLASGVLGANAPWPFQQNSLSQKVEWDGKDNRGKPTPAGSKVRVSLGLKPEVDRDLFQFNSLDTISGLAVDRQGLVYAMMNGPRMMVFSRDGNYQRTLLPPPAGIKPERFPLSDWGETVAGAATPIRGSEADLGARDPFVSRLMVRQTPAITPDGRLFWVSGGGMQDRSGRHRSLLVTDTRDGSMLPEHVKLDQRAGGRSHQALLGAGGVSQAVSPDGKWLYFGSHESMQGSLVGRSTPHYMYWGEIQFTPALFSHHAVYRTSLDNPGLVEPVLGEVKTAGDDNAHFNRPRGVAFDGKGNLYVADHGNHRIQVFDANLKYMRTIPVKHPDHLAVHPETGAIYVLCSNLTGNGPGSELRLVKLGGPNHEVMAEIKGGLGSRQTTGPGRKVTGHLLGCFALDAFSNPPAVWVADIGADVVRFEDRGTEFQKTAVFSLENLGTPQPEIEGNPILGGAGDPAPNALYVTADPYREEIYVRPASSAFGQALIRMDGRTGKVIERLNVPAIDTRVGPDGILYGRGARHAQPYWLWRYDPDARTFLPFPDNELSGEVPTGSIPAGPVFECGRGKYFQAIMGVGANGDIYVTHSPEPSMRARLKAERGLDVPDQMYMDLLAVFSSTGKLKTLHAFDGYLVHRGRPVFRIGPSGAVYMSHHLQPMGQSVPDGLKTKRSAPNWGSVVKFDSRFGEFPVGRIRQRSVQMKDDLGGEPTHDAGRYGAVRIGNMAWDYGGMGRLTHSGCTCTRSAFDVDRFERVFVPVPMTCSVNILDANGNVILRAGQYGNTDNRGRESLVRDPKTGMLRPRKPGDPVAIESPFSQPDMAFMFPQYMGATDEALYVMDSGRRRLIRVSLGYHAEETVPAP